MMAMMTSINAKWCENIRLHKTKAGEDILKIGTQLANTLPSLLGNI